MYILYATRELGVEPSVLGVIAALGSCGALLGAMLAGRIMRWFGLGSTIIGAEFIGGIGVLLIPLASGSLIIAFPLLVTATFLTGLGTVVYNVNQVSLRQAVVPTQLQGCLNASIRFIVYGTIPLGSLLGGVLGEVFGVRLTLFIGALGTLLACSWVFLSPVRMLREQPISLESL